MSKRSIAIIPAALLAASLAGSAFAGSVTGTVKYDGPVPAAATRPIRMDADPVCAKKHDSDVMPEMLVLGEGQTVGNIFVYVKSGLAKKDYPTPSTPVTLDQDGCLYSPHVMGVMVNQPFKILNSDGLLHNVHSLPKVNQGFNRAMPANVKEADFTFSKEEFMFKVKCDVHPWMGAYVAVMSHPFFAVTAADGNFKLDGLPAGTYEIEAWHEKMGTQTATVTIGADESKAADFTFTPPSRD